MLKKSFVSLLCLIAASLLMTGVTVDAQASCPGASTLSLMGGSSSAASTTSATVCYRIRDMPLTTTGITIDVSVTSGGVNIYWAGGDVSTLAHRLNAQEITASNRFNLDINNLSAYTLAIAPTAQSTFSVFMSVTLDADLIGASDAASGDSTADRVDVESEPSHCPDVDDKNPCGPSVPRCVEDYVLREAFAGDDVCVTSDVREQVQYDNSQFTQRIDPTNVYGPDLCAEGYVWRLASPDDHVCVTPDVWLQTAYDNSQASNRWESPLPSEPVTNPPAGGEVLEPGSR